MVDGPAETHPFTGLTDDQLIEAAAALELRSVILSAAIADTSAEIAAEHRKLRLLGTKLAINTGSRKS